MQAEFITVTEYCIHHHTDAGFIEALEQSGLITLTEEEEQRLIHYDQLKKLESYIRWHNDLDINLEGIEAIRYLVDKVETMQTRIHQLEAKLRHYEQQPSE